MKKEVAGCILGLLTVFVTIPVSMFIQYSVMKQVNLSDFVWFAFWFYWPLVFIIAMLAEIVKAFLQKDEK